MRQRFGLAVMMVWLSVCAGSAMAAPRAIDVGKLQVGQPQFWDGEPVSGSAVNSATPLAPGSAGTASCALVPCFDYTLMLEGGADRLRVALDQRNLCNVFHLELIDPDGHVVATGTTDATEYAAPSDLRAYGALYGEFNKLTAACGYSVELYAKQPAAGRWKVRAIASRVTETDFRMRAKLERERADHRPVHEVLPDMVSTPPFEFTFAAPVPSDSPGCRPEEVRNYDAKRCLRFSIGPQNRGEGALDLRYQSAQGVTEPGTVRQRIHRSDGTVSRERDAGQFLYHKEHGHYHYGGFGRLELYRLDAEGMHKVSDGPKIGACTGPYGIAEWHSFANDVRGSAPHDCAAVSPAQGAAIGLEPGWTDIYTSGLEGNYVEFGDQPDGRYVVVVGTDTKDEIVESDETNNASYAVIDVAGDQITVVERGFGDGPGGLPADDWYPDHPPA